MPSRGYLAASAANPSPVQPASAIVAIKATIGLLPALAAPIAMIIFIKYPLNDDRFKQIRDETEARKLAATQGHREDSLWSSSRRTKPHQSPANRFANNGWQEPATTGAPLSSLG